MIKWQTDINPSSHSIVDTFLTEAAQWASVHSISSSNSALVAPLYPECDHEAIAPKISRRAGAQVIFRLGPSQRCETLYIN